MHPTEIQGLRATSMVPGAGIGVLLQLTLAFATGPIYEAISLLEEISLL